MRTVRTADETGDWVRFTAYALAIATVLGGVETVKAALAARSVDPSFGWARAAATNLPWWFVWAALVPLIVWLSRRVPFRQRAWHRAAGIHAIASVLCSLVHLCVCGVIIWAASSHRFQSLDAQLRTLLLGYLLTDLVTYWAILAAYTTLASRRRLRTERAEKQNLALRAARTEMERARLEARMTEARLHALRMELNPHFLFNALNGVSALARRGDADAAVRMLAKLGELLRRTLDGELENEITITEELTLLDLYLEVERARFGDRLTATVRVDPAVENAIVPTFILQPLVENAIRHGASAVRGPMAIEVDARPAGDALQIRVRDTGPGPAAGETGEGVGLRNTRNRLAALYGAGGRVELSATAGGGTEVRVQLPLRRDEGARVA